MTEKMKLAIQIQTFTYSLAFNTQILVNLKQTWAFCIVRIFDR